MSGLFDAANPEKRERILLILGGIVFAVVLIPVLYSFLWTDLSKNWANRNRLRQDVAKLESEVKDKNALTKQLAEWTAKSLPSNDDFAESLYQNWLLGLADEVGITEKRVDRPSATQLKTQNKIQYRKYTFTLHGKGTLEEIAEFLRRFHKTDYLHLVRKVAPRPIRSAVTGSAATRGAKEMDVSITVEALSLPQAASSRTLPEIDQDALKWTDAERAMLKNITDRDLFSAYVPPRPAGATQEPERRPDRFDHSPYCYITSVVEVDDKPQVWIDIRTEGQKYKLYEGEHFRLGEVRCTVKKIEFDRVHVEAAGGMFTIKVGNSFAQYE